MPNDCQMCGPLVLPGAQICKPCERFVDETSRANEALCPKPECDYAHDRKDCTR